MSALVPIRNTEPVVSSSTWIDLLTPAAELAGQIAGTDFVPTSMRNKPAAVAACILYGAEIGIGPMQALAKVDIINGRPAPRAELARALALAAGHEVWVEESTNTRVVVCGHRRGSSNVQKVTWTSDDVRKAGISNPNYNKYPRQMLLARASAELVRQMCPDVLGGIGLFAEEAEAEGDVMPAAAPEPVKATATTRKRTTPAQAALPPAPADLPPLPGEDEPDVDPDAITAEQIKKMMACFNDNGIKDRGDRLNFIINVVGRTVASSKELTKAEASTVIDALTPPPSDDDRPPLPDEEPF